MLAQVHVIQLTMFNWTVNMSQEYQLFAQLTYVNNGAVYSVNNE